MRGKMRKLAERGRLGNRLFWMLALGTPLLLSGCVGGLSSSLAALMGPDASLVEDMKQESAQRLTRAQSSDNDNPKKKEEKHAGPQLPPGPDELLGPPPTGQLAPPAPGQKYRVNVGAWVNGKPLFEEEIFFQAMTPPMMEELRKLPPSQQAEEKHKFLVKQRDHVIEQELMFQDAIHKLENGNPKMLEKIKKMAREEYNKQLARVRENLKNNKQQFDEVQMREFTKLLQRKVEREFIATEYMKSKIYPEIIHRIGPPEIREYYQNHFKDQDFQKPERVEWQDVFIAVGDKHPTIADARRKAEYLIAQYRRDGDFKKLLDNNDGDSKARNGEGFGNRRGQIRPVEVEEHLFKLRDGEFGPLVEFPQGVHIIRLVKHDVGGQIPFNEAVQNQIRNKLRGEVAEREYKHLVHQLRSRAVIEVEEAP